MSSDGNAKSYMLDRSYRESARLYVQHWLWGQHCGYQIHPKIPLSSGMRVLDVGTGNACWVVEVARSAPTDVHFLGVDISRDQFPAAQHMPPNVKLDILDAFAEIPAEYVGAFDVVHARALSTLVAGNNPALLRNNLLKLLRPGGYLQWDELDCASFTAQPVGDVVPGVKTEALLAHWRKFAANSNLDWRWLSSIPEILKTEGVEILHSERTLPRPDLFKPFADDFCIALYDIGRIAASKDPERFGTAEEWRTLFEDMLPEAAQGVGITMDLLVCVGRKPA